MDESAIIPKLTQIFRSVLENDTIDLTPATSAEDVPEWDSMNHIFLVVEIERKFSVKFHTAELEELKNVGDLAQLIAGKLAKSAA